ncbi:YCF48-related protein [Hymenobacter elongatus]|uniref:YCF48-related protein n=1 Tax=Hymenobacter elongatus TaxID=877208 RepID=UPI001436A63F|nr:YCF48-related protein [Hymenobacter elongatus]
MNKGPGGQSLSSIHFFDATLGYTAGSGGTLYRTRDGGTTWQLIPNFQTQGLRNRIRSVAQPVLGTVLLVFETPNGPQPTSLYLSSDAGNNFAFQQYGTFNNLSFRKGNKGLLLGDAGTLKFTTFEGYLWIAVSSGTSNNLRDGDCPSPDGCFVVGDGGTIRRSSPDAYTWQAQNSTTSTRLNAVSFPDAQRGYVVGDAGMGLRTLNAGATWTRMTMGTTVNLNDVHFLSTQVGFAVGELGTILLTTDGGTSWQAEPSNMFETLYSIAATADGNSIWVAGDAGTVLKRGPVVLAAGSATANSVWQVYPNPFTSSLTVQLPQRQGQDWELSLLDNLGRTVAHQQGSATTSHATLPLPVSASSVGIYWLRLKMGQLVETKRLVRMP